MKTITISDETYEKIKEQVEKEETKKEVTETYPIATIDDPDDEACQRLILNLRDEFLATEYKGKLLSIQPRGGAGLTFPKTIKKGRFYGNKEIQVFPIE